ncbi:Hypothetical predicted protein [Octopus vulgaris]|uniref:Serine/arginine repetitive matrix protein 2-like n=1 Tax=Octopus vulgaris TaxID=6645 RepID=A0AA36F5L2_OCTVU|nr:Hypothetical predicted protein [Octopus vulgaris]
MNTIEKDSISSYEHLYSQTEETADHSQYPDDLNEELCITTGLNKCEAIIEDTIGHVDSLDNVGENSNANDNDDMMKRIEIDVRVSQNNDQLNDYGENCSAKHDYSKDVKTGRCVCEVADDKNVYVNNRLECETLNGGKDVSPDKHPFKLNKRSAELDKFLPEEDKENFATNKECIIKGGKIYLISRINSHGINTATEMIQNSITNLTYTLFYISKYSRKKKSENNDEISSIRKPFEECQNFATQEPNLSIQKSYPLCISSRRYRTSFADMPYSNTSVRKSINSSRKNSKSKISALLRCRTFSYSRNNNNSAEPHSRPPSPISRRFRRLRDSLELAARSREIPIAHLPRSSTHVPYSRLRDSLELAARSRGIPVALLPPSTTHVPYSRLRDSLELARSRGVQTELSPHSTAHIPYSRLRDSLELAARSRGIPVALLPPSTTHVPYSRLRDSLELARSRGVPTGLSTHSTAHIPYGRSRDSLELAARSRGIPVALLPPSTTHVPYSRLRDSLELARSRGVPTGLSTHSTAHIPYGRIRDSLELARSSQLREPRYAPEYQFIENSPHSYRGSLEPVNIDISNRSLYASPRSSMSPYKSQHSLSRSSISMPSLRCRCRSISEQSMPSQYWLPRPLRRSSVPAGLLWPATSSPEQYRVRDLQTTDIVVPQEFEKQVSPFVTWDPDTSRWSRDFEDSLAEFWDKSKRIDVVGRGTSTRPASILREKSRGADRVHWRSSLAPEASFRFRRLSSPRQSTPSPHRSPRLRSSSPLAPRTSFRLRRSSSPRRSTPSPYRSPRLRSSSPLAPRTSFRLRRSSSPRRSTPSPYRSPRLRSSSPLAPRTSFRLRHSSSPRRSTPSPYRSPRLRSSSPLAPRTSFRLRRSSSPRRSTPSPYRSPRLRSSSPLAPRTSFRLHHSSSSRRRAPSQYRLPSTRRSSSMPAGHLWHTTSSPDKYRVRDLQTSDIVVPQELEQLSPIRAPPQDPLWSNASTPEHYRVRDFQTTNIIVDPQEFEKQVGPFVTWDPDTSRWSRDFEDSLEEFWENSYREDSRHKSPLVKYSSSNSLGPETSFDLSYILSPGRSTSSSSRSQTLDSSSPLGPETSFRLRRSSSSGRSIPSQYQLPSPRRSSSISGRRIPSQYRLSRPLRSSSVPAGPLWSNASTPEQYRVRDFQTTNIRIDPQEFEQVSPFVTWDPDTSRWSRDFEDSLAELWNKPMRINVVGRGTSTKSAAILPEKSKGADGVSRGTYTRPASILREESIVTDGARRGTYTVPTSMLHRGTYTKPASILRDESNRSSSSYDSSASAEYKSRKLRGFQTTNIIIDPQEFEKQVSPFVTWDPDTSRWSRDFEDSLEEFWANPYRKDSRHKSPLVKYSSSSSLGPETSFDLRRISSPWRSASSSSRSRTLDSSSLGPDTSFDLRRIPSPWRSILSSSRSRTLDSSTLSEPETSFDLRRISSPGRSTLSSSRSRTLGEDTESSGSESYSSSASCSSCYTDEPDSMLADEIHFQSLNRAWHRPNLRRFLN